MAYDSIVFSFHNVPKLDLKKINKTFCFETQTLLPFEASSLRLGRSSGRTPGLLWLLPVAQGMLIYFSTAHTIIKRTICFYIKNRRM